MKIAELLLRPQIGGAESLVRDLVVEWGASGHDVRVFYVHPKARDLTRGQTVWRLRRQFRQFDPDVIHSHSALPNLYGRLASRRRWPVVTVLHSASRDFDSARLRIAEKLLQRWTAGVVAVSAVQVEEYRSSISAQAQIHLIPNGIRKDPYPVSHRSNHKLTAVAVGRLAPQKRIELLIRAWGTRVANELPDLQIVGSGGDPEYVRSLQQLHRVAGSSALSFLGPVDDVRAILRSSHMFVHAADREAHPIALLEAAGAGLPLVVSESVARLLPAEASVITFADGDHEALSAAVRAMSADYASYESVARQAASGIRDTFSMQRCARRHMAVLRTVALVRPDA